MLALRLKGECKLFLENSPKCPQRVQVISLNECKAVGNCVGMIFEYAVGILGQKSKIWVGVKSNPRMESA